MSELIVRIYDRDGSGKTSDRHHDMELSDFAGVLPAIGDQILYPGVTKGLDRNDPANREIWTVVGRVLNPKDQPTYVCLIVEGRQGTEADTFV